MCSGNLYLSLTHTVASNNAISSTLILICLISCKYNWKIIEYEIILITNWNNRINWCCHMHARLTFRITQMNVILVNIFLLYILHSNESKSISILEAIYLLVHHEKISSFFISIFIVHLIKKKFLPVDFYNSP